jgi:predicted GH43/DUF377 family glycosyl hydrolase
MKNRNGFIRMEGEHVTMRPQIGIRRSPLNPLVTPADVKPSFPDWEVLGAFNAGVAECGDEIVLLLRVAERPRQTDPNKVTVPVMRAGADGFDDSSVRIVELDRRDPDLDFGDRRVVKNRRGETIWLTSISHLRVARSRDGERFTVDDRPSVVPAGPLETWGIEDPRITMIDGRYYITYSAVSEKGVAVGLMSTGDFRSFRREGTILAPTNKDVVLFPEKIGGKYMMVHRPVPEGIGKPEIWIAESPDLIHWGNHRFLMGLSASGWESARIGAGCVPIRTDEGWLLLYHGADHNHRYCMGAALLDADDPGRVLARTAEPIMEPGAEYETDGFFGGVVFACGAIVRDGLVTMYYGVSDESTACATFRLDDVFNFLK